LGVPANVSKEFSLPCWDRQTADLPLRRKRDPMKLRWAAPLRRETPLTLKWIAARLKVGTWKPLKRRRHELAVPEKGEKVSKLGTEYLPMKTKIVSSGAVGLAAGVSHLRRLAVLMTALLAAHLAPAATVIWSGGGANQNWSLGGAGGNWGGSPAPGPADDVKFFDLGGTNQGSVNNIVDVNRTIRSLQYANSNNFHTTLIAAGQTLTITNGLTVGTGTSNGADFQITATITGAGGTLALTGGNLFVGQPAENNGSHRASLDLSGLDTFNANCGRLLVGVGDSSLRRVIGRMALAVSNTISLSGPDVQLMVGDNPGTFAGNNLSYLLLGATNTINVNTIRVGGARQQGSMSFGIWTHPLLVLRGANGTGRVGTIAIGDNQPSSGNPSTGVLDLSGGTADVLADTVYAGRGQTNNGAGATTGTLTFGKGTFDINTLEVGYQNASTAAAVVTGTVNISAGGSSRKSATLVVNTSLRLARYTGSGTVPVGSFNITNGTVQASTITSGGGTNTISLIGGTLMVTNSSGSIGTIAAPIGTFSIGDSELVLAVRDGFTNVVVTTLTTTSTTNNMASIASLPVITSYPAQYPLVGYSSANGFDFLLGTLPATPDYHGYISNDTARSSIDLVIGGISRALTWNGTPNGDWDTSTTNWLGSGSLTAYNQYDYVLFDDTASGTTTVNLTTTLTPRTLTISNLSYGYTFTGTGSLSGATGLDKKGTGMLIIGNSGSNGFAGGITIGGGTLQISGSDNRLPPNSAVVLSNVVGAVLDLNNLNQAVGSLAGGGVSGGNVTLGSGTLTLNGGVFRGVLSGSGAVVKNGSGTQGFTGANLYTGGTVVNAGALVVANATGSGVGPGSVLVDVNGELRFGNGGPGGSVAAGTITNNGMVVFNRSDDFTLTNVIVGGGGVAKNNTNTVFIPNANTYTGATTIGVGALRIGNAGSLGTGSAGTTVQNDPTARLELTGNLTLAAPLALASKNISFGNPPAVVNVSGSNTLSGPITGTSGGVCWTFEVDADKLVVAGSFTNSTTSSQRAVRLRGNALGEWRSSLGNSTSNLSVTALLKEEPGTWVLSGTNNYTGFTTVSNGTLLVNGGILASTNVVVYGGTLGGTGLITAPVAVAAGGTLAPGCSLGTLTISNTLTLNGTNLMEVSHAAADQVAGLTSVTLGGTLKVVVTDTLTGGESFRLFVATNYSGDFAVYDLPALSGPLSWDTNSVPVDGTLKVVSSQPTLAFLRTATNTLVFSWSGAGFHLQAQTNALSTGLSTNWNDYPGGSTSPVIVPLDVANPTVFYRLVSP
jgi:autotransporter-associated beta strand protein